MSFFTQLVFVFGRYSVQVLTMALANLAGFCALCEPFQVNSGILPLLNYFCSWYIIFK